MPGRWPDQTLDQAFGLPEGAGRRPHLASVFQRNRKSPNIHTSSEVIWGMSAPLPRQRTSRRWRGRRDSKADLRSGDPDLDHMRLLESKS
jgi:hypothetical protein